MGNCLKSAASLEAVSLNEEDNKTDAEKAAETRLGALDAEIKDLRTSVVNLKSQIRRMASVSQRAKGPHEKELYRDTMRDLARQYVVKQNNLERKKALQSRLQSLYHRWTELKEMGQYSEFFNAFTTNVPDIKPADIASGLKSASATMDSWTDAREDVIEALYESQQQGVVTAFPGSQEDGDIDDILARILQDNETEEPVFAPYAAQVKVEHTPRFSVLDEESGIFNDEDDDEKHEDDSVKMLRSNGSVYYC
jgi:hypothetical protein